MCALLAGGGYAERVAVPAAQLLPVPAGVELVDGRGAARGDLHGVVQRVHAGRAARRGETLLVHGGSSGIGTMAIQLAAARGRPGAGHRRHGGEARRCRELGADVAINYREQDFVEAVQARRPTARGADVILDNMGAKYLARNVDALAVGGRLVVIGMQGGTTAELDLGTLHGKRAAVTPPRCGRGR